MIREYKPAGSDSWHKYYESESGAVKRRDAGKAAIVGAVESEDWVKDAIVGACFSVGIAAIVFGMLWLGSLLDFISQH